MKTVSWKACLSLFRIRFAESFQYRLAALSGASISVFWALIECTVYIVFFTYGNPALHGTNGMTLSQAVSYAWVAQFLVPLQPMSIDEDILAEIVGGNVSIALVRPLDLYTHWFFKTAAGRLGGFWLRGGLTLVVGLLLPTPYGLALPASLVGFLLFLLAAASAFVLCTAYGMLITCVRLGISWGEGPSYILLLLGGVLSGAYLPLQLWPNTLQSLLLWQPFAGSLDIPTRLYVGSASPAQGLWMLLLQWGWILAMILLGRGLMRRKLRSLVVQGG